MELGLWEVLLGEVNRLLEAKHIIMTEVRINIIDATPVEAAQSVYGKNADDEPKGCGLARKGRQLRKYKVHLRLLGPHWRR